MAGANTGHIKARCMNKIDFHDWMKFLMDCASDETKTKRISSKEAFQIYVALKDPRAGIYLQNNYDELSSDNERARFIYLIRCSKDLCLIYKRWYFSAVTIFGDWGIGAGFIFSGFGLTAIISQFEGSQGVGMFALVGGLFFSAICASTKAYCNTKGEEKSADAARLQDLIDDLRF